MARRKTKPFSARLDVTVLKRLRDGSERAGESNSRLAERLLDEGLRMDEFPGIVFRSGPTGRRAGLARGPDVWEIVRDIKSAAAAGAPDPIGSVVEASHLGRGQVELAAAYYEAYPDEVDERMRANDEMAERVRRMLEASAPAE